MEEYKNHLLEQIEIYKKNAIENVKNENMVPAMWDISALIDLKAQVSTIEKMEKEE